MSNHMRALASNTRGWSRFSCRFFEVDPRSQFLGNKVRELPRGPQVACHALGMRAHAKPEKVIADARNVPFEQRARVAVLARIDGLREVDHGCPAVPDKHVVRG